MVEESANGKLGKDNHEDELMIPDDKLRELARLIHLQEAQHISTIPVQSVHHRVQLLRDSRKVYDSAVGILDLGDEVKRKHQDDKVGGSVAHEFYRYSKLTVGFACRTMYNLNLRDSYLKKLRTFAEATKLELDGVLSETSVLSAEQKLAKAREIFQELAEHKQLSLDFIRSRQTPSTRYFATVVRRVLQKSNLMFDDMVDKYMAKMAKTDLSYKVRFQKLTRVEGSEVALLDWEEIAAEGMLKKASVYREIAGLTGKGKFNTLAKIGKGAGAGLVLFQVGMIAWDTYSSDHPLQTFTKDSVETGVSVAAGLAGEIAGSAAVTAGLGVFGITAAASTAAAAFVCVASIATGFGAALAVGALAGFLLDKLFESGGKAPQKSVPHPSHKSVVRHPASEHLELHFTPIPDGNRLARQLTAASNS